MHLLGNGNGSGFQLTFRNIGAPSSCLVKGGLPDPVTCWDIRVDHSCLCLLLWSLLFSAWYFAFGNHLLRCSGGDGGPAFPSIIYLRIFLPSGEPGLRFLVYIFTDSVSIKGAPQWVGLSSRLILDNFEEKLKKSLNVCPGGQVSQSGTKTGAGGEKMGHLW